MSNQLIPLRFSMEEIQTYTRDQIQDVLKHVKAARKILDILNDVEKRRIQLMRIEMYSIIRLFELGEKLPSGISKENVEFFISKSNDKLWWEREYPECLTTYSLCRELNNTRHFDQHKQEAIDMWKKRLKEQSSRPNFLISRRDIRTAFSTILSGIDVETSIDEISKKIASDLSGDEALESEAFMTGIKEVVSDIFREYDDIENNPFPFQTPKFVTFEKNGLFCRIPFIAATMDQLKEMLEIRMDRLKALQTRVSQIQSCYDWLNSICKNDMNMPIGEIIRLSNQSNILQTKE